MGEIVNLAARRYDAFLESLTEGAFCGCCGIATGPGKLWCDRCEMHTLKVGRFELRTYFGQRGQECPFQQ